ncbi:MAG TPA: DUF4340 domain-containing protein [Candidatus Aminicenantes bacterium]|nr:DUF4340 domain-containing protein [Candidatus Aminicenantes bacterium]
MANVCFYYSSPGSRPYYRIVHLVKKEVTMRFRTTLILMVIFIVLLTGVVLIEHHSEVTKEKKEKQEQLTDIKSAEIEKISLKNEGQPTITLQKDDKGNWKIIEPLVTEADNYEANSLAENFAGLRIEKVVEKQAQAQDLKAYEIPKKEVILWVKGQKQPIKILIGMENPLDNTLYAKREDQSQVVLLPSYLKYSLDKKLFDLRKKELLKFETKDVQAIEVHSKDLNWKARRQGENWLLVQPVEALAAKSQIDSLLDKLSGLKAKDFLVEEKKDEDLKNYNLDKPEFTIKLDLPSAEQISIQLAKKGEKLIASSSLSKKIIEIDNQILTDLNKKIDDWREKKVANFNSWEVTSISIKRVNQIIAANKEKVTEKGKEEEKWQLQAEGNKKELADESKIESVLRKLEYLEASGFIDQPTNLSDYGLDKPEIEIIIKSQPQDQEAQEIRLLLGKDDKTKKQVVVKNASWKYLFLVDDSFLSELPTKIDDWKKVENKK